MIVVFKDPYQFILSEDSFVGPAVLDWNYGLATFIGGHPKWSTHENGLVWGVNVDQASFSVSGLGSYVGDEAEGDKGGG
jgi:hypothetical protein